MKNHLAIPALLLATSCNAADTNKECRSYEELKIASECPVETATYLDYYHRELTHLCEYKLAGNNVNADKPLALKVDTVTKAIYSEKDEDESKGLAQIGCDISTSELIIASALAEEKWGTCLTRWTEYSESN